MSASLRKLKPIELCMMLNSTPLGIVISEMQARRHLTLAGYRIGSGKTIDLLAYCAWLLSVKHRLAVCDTDSEIAPLEREAACDAATVCLDRVNSRKRKSYDHLLIAALLTEPTHARAAQSAGISSATLYRRLQDPEFHNAYEATRRELAASSVARLQLHSRGAVKTLVHVQQKGRRDADRIRAAALVLDHSRRVLPAFEPAARADRSGRPTPVDTVSLLTEYLRQVQEAPLPQAEKSKLTVTLTAAKPTAPTTPRSSGNTAYTSPRRSSGSRSTRS